MQGYNETNTSDKITHATMQLSILLLVVINCIEISSKEAVPADDFTLAVDYYHVLAVVDLPFNFSVSIHSVKWVNKSVEVRRRLLLMIISMFFVGILGVQWCLCNSQI